MFLTTNHYINLYNTNSVLPKPDEQETQGPWQHHCSSVIPFCFISIHSSHPPDLSTVSSKVLEALHHGEIWISGSQSIQTIPRLEMMCTYIHSLNQTKWFPEEMTPRKKVWSTGISNLFWGNITLSSKETDTDNQVLLDIWLTIRKVMTSNANLTRFFEEQVSFPLWLMHYRKKRETSR